MELIKSVQFEFSPTVNYFLDRYPLTDAERDVCDRQLKQDTNLDPITQQRLWYEFCPQDLKAKLEHKRCLVHFNFYICGCASVKEDDEYLVYGVGTYILFQGSYACRPYRQLTGYINPLKAFPKTMFQYIIWLYCLSEKERQFFVDKNYNHRHDLVIQIRVHDIPDI